MVSADTPERVVHRFAELLDTAGIPYMLTGSFASGFHGAPRATQDIDFVVSPTLGTLARFVDALPPDEYYVDRQTAFEAYGRESMFNIIDLRSGWKVDLICRKSRAYSMTEFERRSCRDLAGVAVYVASAEDSVISKLEWAKLSQSERQLEDVAGVVRIQKGDLDLAYVAKWVEQLGLVDQWVRAKSLAG